MKKKASLVELLEQRFEINPKKAIGLILSGNVLVDEKILSKPNFKIDINSKIRIKEQKKYVGRGAYKLLTAFKYFNLNVKDKICMDVGSSTGGFTEILILKEAKKVYAIDCGTNQLDYSLRINPKVVSMENTKIMELKKNDINDDIEIAVMDVSFTSSINIIVRLFDEFKIKKLITLIKPQFEYERLIDILNLEKNFNGVAGEKESEEIFNYVKEEIIKSGLIILASKESDIEGTKGNKEYLVEIESRYV
ncbi:MAG TPA: TlyA family RNA methyltransferase [Spirochaetota bacterium]|nr:TlyA family RNA methyltransferase [Spirochaetota bacterium]